MVPVLAVHFQLIDGFLGNRVLDMVSDTAYVSTDEEAI